MYQCYGGSEEFALANGGAERKVNPAESPSTGLFRPISSSNNVFLMTVRR